MLHSSHTDQLHILCICYKPHGNHNEKARKTETSKYYQNIRQVLKSQLNGKNKIQTMNTYDLSVIRYPADIVSWPKQDMEAAIVKIQKLFTMYRNFYPNCNTERLHTTWKVGRWGLVSVKAMS